MRKHSVGVQEKKAKNKTKNIETKVKIIIIFRQHVKCFGLKMSTARTYTLAHMRSHKDNLKPTTAIRKSKAVRNEKETRWTEKKAQSKNDENRSCSCSRHIFLFALRFFSFSFLFLSVLFVIFVPFPLFLMMYNEAIERHRVKYEEQERNRSNEIELTLVLVRFQHSSFFFCFIFSLSMRQREQRCGSARIYYEILYLLR